MFNTQHNPYPNGNFATTEDILEEIALVISEEKSRQPISETNGGFENVTVNDTAVVNLTIPTDAISADISVEADATALSKAKVIRFKENGSNPSTSSGFPFGEGIFKVIGKNNLNNFKIIGIEAGKSHTLQVQYYKTVQIV